VRISVDPEGHPWVVNKKDIIYVLGHNKKWQVSSGRAKDIGVGADGTVAVIGTNKESGGFGVYTRKFAVKSAWGRINGAATDIDVDGTGLAWVVNKSQYIF